MFVPTARVMLQHTHACSSTPLLQRKKITSHMTHSRSAVQQQQRCLTCSRQRCNSLPAPLAAARASPFKETSISNVSFFYNSAPAMRDACAHARRMMGRSCKRPFTHALNNRASCSTFSSLKIPHPIQLDAPTIAPRPHRLELSSRCSPHHLPTTATFHATISTKRAQTPTRANAAHLSSRAALSALCNATISEGLPSAASCKRRLTATAIEASGRATPP